ncbi:hypothetical protein DFH06DRAFT_1476590 [Mycena polygramma]|nr:hypothetical protein DFH06DRAFT_1476590 [Mycena polygramma]
MPNITLRSSPHPNLIRTTSRVQRAPILYDGAVNGGSNACESNLDASVPVKISRINAQARCKLVPHASNVAPLAPPSDNTLGVRRKAESCPRVDEGKISHESIPARPHLKSAVQAVPKPGSSQFFPPGRPPATSSTCAGVRTISTAATATTLGLLVTGLKLTRMTTTYFDTLLVRISQVPAQGRMVPIKCVVSAYRSFSPSPYLTLPSRPFPSLPVPSRPFPSLPFPSLPVPSRPFPSLPVPSRPFHFLSSLPSVFFLLSSSLFSFSLVSLLLPPPLLSDALLGCTALPLQCLLPMETQAFCGKGSTRDPGHGERGRCTRTYPS